MSNLRIRRVGVLGAGVMGSQIVALFANFGFDVSLYDLPSEGERNALVSGALSKLKKLKPAPLALPAIVDSIKVANYGDDLASLSSCDLIIEAVAENFSIKQELYSKLSKVLTERNIFVSNTSGLSVNALKEALPEKLWPTFCGVHFFNPPRYMQLVELIPTSDTDPALLDQLESFLVSTLGKGVVRAKDTPNFIANRVGVFSLLATIHHAIKLEIPFEIVDSLTGPYIGRPKSGTMRLMDVVGLDTMIHVINTMTENLTIDPWAEYYKVPNWLQAFVDKGALGQKTRCGIYKKEGKAIHVWDVNQDNYRAAEQTADPAVLEILKIKSPSERFSKLRESSHPQAQFVWRIMRDLFHYCAVHGASIADNVRDIDFAMRWGFGWKQGPFEIWQSIGWAQINSWLTEEIKQSQTLAEAELPQWVHERKNDGVYVADGAFAFAASQMMPRSTLAVYKKQDFADPLLDEYFDEGETLFETDTVRLWRQEQDIAILSFKSKMNTVPGAVLDGIQQAIEVVNERQLQAMVIWQRRGTHFSLGADLKEFSALVSEGNNVALDAAVAKFQETSLALRYTPFPVVAAIRGMVLGGGCELMLHCDRVVAGFESYIGLVELGVGLVPAGGGCKEAVLRANQMAFNGDVFTPLSDYFMQVAKAETSTNAISAKACHWLKQSDVIVNNVNEILHVATAEARLLAANNYQPPLPPRIKVVGHDGCANWQVQLVNYLEGHFISEYDYHLASQLAYVLSGGDVASGEVVDEAWLLQLEREVFVSLAMQEKTQARIKHTLTTGKPLRN